MKKSILNDVLGPVMRGPSSSHTAGSFHIARLVYDLLGERPQRVQITFDHNGSYGQTYNKQNADKGFAAGFSGRTLMFDDFDNILKITSSEGMRIKFKIGDLSEADHPNFVRINLTDKKGAEHVVMAKSIGGGSVVLSKWDDWSVNLTGADFGALIIMQKDDISVESFEKWVKKQFKNICVSTNNDKILFNISAFEPISSKALQFIQNFSDKIEIRKWNALQKVKKGKCIYNSLPELEMFLKKGELSLGEAGLAYESELLGISKEESYKEMLIRLEIMKDSAKIGFVDNCSKMQLLNPTASKIKRAIVEKKVALGGPHALAGARAMAVMHACNSGAIVCAAPTGGSAGVIPAVMITLRELFKLNDHQQANSLYAAGVVGWAVASQATFAAETAGCQVEIGAAGAMAAAAVVEAVGGSARQAMDAAAIAFQNTMGSTCDLVQGICEIPCHTRNAAAASNAFLCADLILGGYQNPIPLEETIDASFEAGKLLPSVLRCTAKGGLAITPSALKIKNKIFGEK